MIDKSYRFITIYGLKNADDCKIPLITTTRQKKSKINSTKMKVHAVEEKKQKGASRPE